MVDKLENVLQKTKGMSKEKAKAEVERLREMFMDNLMSGMGICELEDEFMNETGLEPDYVEELLF